MVCRDRREQSDDPRTEASESCPFRAGELVISPQMANPGEFRCIFMDIAARVSWEALWTLGRCVFVEETRGEPTASISLEVRDATTVAGGISG